MPRVLHVINDLSHGGATTQLRLLAQRSEAIVATRRRPMNAESLPAEVTWLGGRFRHDPFATRRLQEITREHAPDVLQSWDEPSARLCRAARGGSGARWIHTARGAVSDWLCVSQADGVIATSESIAEQLATQNIHSELVVNAYPPELAADRLPERAAARRVLRAAGADVGDDSPLIATVARLDDPAGVKELAWAADLVRAVRPGLRLLVVGDGPARGAGERFADAACESGLVVWLGAWDELQTVYAAADVIWCGRGGGIGSTPAIEAAAAGKPVLVAGDPDGQAAGDEPRSPRVLVWDDRAGWARITHQVLGEPELALQLGRLGAERAYAHHNADRVADRHSGAIVETLRPVAAA